jgi:hypothetical protein
MKRLSNWGFTVQDNARNIKPTKEELIIKLELKKAKLESKNSTLNT